MKNLQDISTEISRLIDDMVLSEEDRNMYTLFRELNTARKAGDVKRELRIVIQMRDYLKDLQKNVISINMDYEDGIVEVIQDMRYGKVIGVRWYIKK